MSHVSSSVRRSRGVAAVLVLVAGLLAAGFGAAYAGPTTTPPPPPLGVTVTTDNGTLLGADAVPNVLTTPGNAARPLIVQVTAPAGYELSKGTVIDLTVVQGTGKLSASSFKVALKGTTASTTVTYGTAENGIKIQAAVHKPTSTSPTPGTSNSFNVVSTLRLDASTKVPSSGYGSDTCNTSSSEPVCATVDLPQGISSSQAALSLGPCTGQNCRVDTKVQEVQFVAGMAGYDKGHPAVLKLQCDKAYCPGKGVSSYTAYISLSATGGLEPSKPCLAKGVIPDTLEYCTDYVSSHRDNAGDVILEVLFYKDMRGTM